MSNITVADEAILQTALAQKGHPKGLGVMFTTEMWSGSISTACAPYSPSSLLTP